MASEIRVPQKLIQVALPLDAINAAAAKEKSIRHGHPSTLHLWWARRPLAATRAVLFAQLVNDPGYERYLGRGVNKDKAHQERERLFKIIEQLVLWENTHNPEVIKAARDEIRRSWRETCALNKDHPRASELFNPDSLPAFHDPFAGGGAIPLEAQRLGLETYASDLNPVAVTINIAMIEVPSRFAGARPVGPTSRDKLLDDWVGAKGLAQDVRAYGSRIREKALKQIGHLYPHIEVQADMVKSRPELKHLVGQKLNVISWIWARTVKSPNPAYSHVQVPLVSTFVLSSKDGKEVYVEPIIKGDQYEFHIRTGKPPEKLVAGTTAGKRAAFLCLLSGTPIDYDYIRAEGKAGRIGAKLMAVVAEAGRGRIYLPPQQEHVRAAETAKPSWFPEMELPHNPRDFKTPNYGLTRFGDLFTPRQLVLLTTFADLIAQSRAEIQSDAARAGMANDNVGLEEGGTGARAYAEAVCLYLGLALSKLSDAQSSLCRWKNTMDQSIATFGRQAIPMVWDFSEANAFSGMAGDFEVSLANMMRVLEAGATSSPAHIYQADAQAQALSKDKVVSTDPPYYDNIGYADLSDYFYVWLKRALGPILPKLYAQSSTPKTDELVATPYRHGGKAQAEAFFLDGMTRALKGLAENAHPAFPVTIYYAFKQSETTDEAGTSSTGWETFLEAVLAAGFSISGTWPMRTELGNRMIGAGKNVLASSVVLVCNRRPQNAPSVSRREFIRELNAVLPEALEEMTRGGEHSPVAPVDLSQAIIGPGMAIFSKYSAVLEADGKPMSVRTALQLINRFLAEEDFDQDTQFCLQWFDGHSWDAGKFGDADNLARAKGTSVDGLRDGGVIQSAGGQVRLLRFSELPDSWEPESDARLSVWELLHHLMRVLNHEGETGAGKILSRTQRYAGPVRALAYRLYTLCERKGRAQDASHYNAFVLSWDGIEASAQSEGYAGDQISLFGQDTPNKNKQSKSKRTKS